MEPAIVSVTAEPSDRAPASSKTVPTMQAWSIVKVLAPTARENVRAEI